MSSEALLDPKARLSFARMCGLIERAIAITGQPALGALLGWNASVSKFGVLGFAAITAPVLPPDPSAILYFDQPRHRLVFDAAALDLPVTTADAASHRTAFELCERQLIERAPGGLLVQRVARELFAADGGVRSSVQVARAVGMAERTLKRRLAEQRTSYSELLDRARHMRALELLGSELSIEEVAERLGYSDPANFTRAFRRWTGKSPRAVRKSARTL